jgi:hypothetical protein
MVPLFWNAISMNKSSLAELLPLNLPLPPQLEQWRRMLLNQLPFPVTGEQTLFVGEPLSVVVVFEQDGVEVFLPVHQPTMMSSVAPQKWLLQGRISLLNGNYEQLMLLVQSTLNRRTRHFRECSCCGRQVPQELLGSINNQPACRDCLEGDRFLV